MNENEIYFPFLPSDVTPLLYFCEPHRTRWFVLQAMDARMAEGY